MEPYSEPAVLSADCMVDGLLVTFKDGTAAFYYALQRSSIVSQPVIVKREPDSPPKPDTI
jgi:hypothetical protein